MPEYYTVTLDVDEQLKNAFEQHAANYDNDARAFRDALRSGLGLPKPNPEKKRMAGTYVETHQISSFEAHFVARALWNQAESLGESGRSNVKQSYERMARRFDGYAKTRE